MNHTDQPRPALRVRHTPWMQRFAPERLNAQSGIALPTVIVLLAIASLVVGSVSSSALAANGVAEASRTASEAESEANAAFDYVRSAIVAGQVSTQTLRAQTAATAAEAEDPDHPYRSSADLLENALSSDGVPLRDSAPAALQDADVHVYVAKNSWQDDHADDGADAAASLDTFTLSLVAEATVTSDAVSMRTREPVTKQMSADVVVQPKKEEAYSPDCKTNPELYGCSTGEDTYISRGDTNLINTSFGTRAPNSDDADPSNPDVNVYVEGNLNGCMGTDIAGTLTVDGDATMGTKETVYKTVHTDGYYTWWGRWVPGSDQQVPDTDKMKCNVAKSITVKGDMRVNSPSGLVTTYGSTVHVGGNLYLDGNFNIEGDVKVDGDIISISDADTEVNYSASVYAGGSIKMAGKFTVGEDLVAKKDVTVVWSRTACTGDSCGYNVKRNVVSLDGSVYATRFLVADGGSIRARKNVMLRRVTVYGGDVVAETGWVSFQNLKDGREVTDDGGVSGYWNNDQVYGDVWAGNGVYYAHSSSYSTKANPTVYGTIHVLSGEVQYADPYPFIYCDTPDNPSVCENDVSHQGFGIPDGSSFSGQTGLSSLKGQGYSVILVARDGFKVYANAQALPYDYTSRYRFGQIADIIDTGSNAGAYTTLSKSRSCAATSPNPTRISNRDTLSACGVAPAMPQLDLTTLHLPDGWDTATVIEQQKKQPVMTKQYIVQQSTLATWKKYYFADADRKDTTNRLYRGAVYGGTCSDLESSGDGGTDLQHALLKNAGEQGWDSAQKVMLIADCDQPLTIDTAVISDSTDRIHQTQDLAIVSDRGFRFLKSGTDATDVDPNLNLYLLVPTDYNAPGTTDYAEQANYCVKPRTDASGNPVLDADGNQLTRVQYDSEKNPGDHAVFTNEQMNDPAGPNGVIKFGGQNNFAFSNQVNVYSFTPCTVDLNDTVEFRGSIVAGMTYINDKVDNRDVWFVPSMAMPAKIINGSGTGLPTDGDTTYSSRVQVVNRLNGAGEDD